MPILKLPCHLRNGRLPVIDTVCRCPMEEILGPFCAAHAGPSVADDALELIAIFTFKR